MPESTPALHARWSDLPVETMNPLLSRQFVVGTNVMVARIHLQKGCHVPTHSHPNEQISMLLSGCLKLVLHDPAAPAPSEAILYPGELLCIPPNIPHEAFALEDTINIDVFNPPRHDWITGDDAYLRAPAASQT
jgi:quercetin dioxygenase-like cupin family protein